MSARALNWAWECVPSTRPAKLVLVALADRADEEGICWPSRKWLSRKCRPMTVKAVGNAMTQLVADGMIVKEERLRRDDGTLSTWRVRLPIDQGPKTATGQKGALEPVSENGHADSKEPSLSSDEENAGAIGKRIDPLWEAMVEAMGVVPPVTKSGRGSWNAAVKELRDAGASPELVLAAAKHYRKEWPDISITPNALAKHWHVFALTAEAKKPKPPCEECGVGGGLHLAECSKAQREVAA